MSQTRPRGNGKTRVGRRPHASRYGQITRGFVESIIGLSCSQAYRKCERHPSHELRLIFGGDGPRTALYAGFFGCPSSWVKLDYRDGIIVRADAGVKKDEL